MGQLFNRLRSFARSQVRSSETDLQWAERMVGNDDNELRRIIDELHRDYTEGRNTGGSGKTSQTHTRARSSSPTVPPAVLKAHTTLNVAVGATIDEIKKAYRSSIATWHPDRFASAAPDEQKHAHTRAHEINAAYLTLRDHYDFR